MFDVPEPGSVEPNSTAPGERPLPARRLDSAPPRTPRGTEDLLPVGREENVRIACHSVDEKLAGEPTPIPASHYEDLRSEPGKRSDSVIGARWNSIACHARKTSAAPLVESQS